MRGLVKRGETVTLPNTLTIPRDERAYPPAAQAQVSERVPADVATELAPNPVSYTSFEGRGKITNSRFLYQQLSYTDKLSIRASEVNGSAIVQRIMGALVTQGFAGGQVPFTERADIDAPAQTTYASLATLRPPNLSSRPYAKLGG